MGDASTTAAAQAVPTCVPEAIGDDKHDGSQVISTRFITISGGRLRAVMPRLPAYRVAACVITPRHRVDASRFDMWPDALPAPRPALKLSLDI